MKQKIENFKAFKSCSTVGEFNWGEFKKDFSGDDLLYLNLLETVDDMKKNGGDWYAPVTADEFKNLTDGVEYVRGGNGVTMKVTGLIAFGEKVDN